MPPDPRVHCGVAVYIERRVWEDNIGHGEIPTLDLFGSTKMYFERLGFR